MQRGELVLEVAVGPGLSLVELAKRAGHETAIAGVDISSRMLRLAEERLVREGFTNYDLRKADARSLPFDDASFDVLYNGYMLDLIPLDDLPLVLAEFKRVLKPGGRLILLNMSKANETMTAVEKLYARLPAKVVLHLFGMCRPIMVEGLVRAAGFERVSRTYLAGVVASEIVTAVKAAEPSRHL